MKQKHSSLPFVMDKLGNIDSKTDVGYESVCTMYLDNGIDKARANARFIILACNHFEEMREFIAIVESCSGWQKDSEGNYFEENGICPACVEDASKLLAKLEEADAD